MLYSQLIDHDKQTITFFLKPSKEKSIMQYHKYECFAFPSTWEILGFIGLLLLSKKKNQTFSTMNCISIFVGFWLILIWTTAQFYSSDYGFQVFMGLQLDYEQDMVLHINTFKSITMRIIFGFPISLGGRQPSPTFSLAGFRRNGNNIYHQHHNPKNIYIQKVTRVDLI